MDRYQLMQKTWKASKNTLVITIPKKIKETLKIEENDIIRLEIIEIIKKDKNQDYSTTKSAVR